MIKRLLKFFEKNEDLIFKIVMISFMILSAVGIAFHEPWRDEAQAWLIAKDLDPLEIMQHMKYEGHLILWYLALMPFAKLDIPYPLPMQIVNMLFMWAVVFVLWKKSPFNPIIKIFITFSFLFAYQNAVIARCYAIGILLLFLLAAYFKDKTQRPYLYSLLLILCANTSIMAIVGAGAFGLLFLYDYIKEKKKFYINKEFYIILGILSFGVLIIFYQLLYGRNDTSMYQFFNKNLIFALSIGFWNVYIEKLSACYAYIYILLSSIVFVKNKCVFFFFYFTILALYCIFCFVYGGSSYHYQFLFIYFIISLWLYLMRGNNFQSVFEKGLLVILIATLICQNWNMIMNYNYDINYNFSSGKKIAQKIINDNRLRRANFVTCDGLTHVVVPYLRDAKIPIKTCFTGKTASFFDQRLKKGYNIDFKNLNKSDFFEVKDNNTYLIYSQTVKNDTINSLKDYTLKAEYCEEFSVNDASFICIAKILQK